MGSWKTSLAGISTLLSVAVHVLNALVQGTSIDTTVVATGLTTGVGLLFARDNNKTSEQVGAKTTKPEEPQTTT